jgi:hypothetical protein
VYAAKEIFPHDERDRTPHSANVAATRRFDKKRFLSGDTKIKNVAGNTAWSLPQFVFDSRTA